MTADLTPEEFLRLQEAGLVRCGLRDRCFSKGISQHPHKLPRYKQGYGKIHPIVGVQIHLNTGFRNYSTLPRCYDEIFLQEMLHLKMQTEELRQDRLAWRLLGISPMVLNICSQSFQFVCFMGGYIVWEWYHRIFRESIPSMLLSKDWDFDLLCRSP